MKIIGIKCLSCKEKIFSRARYDFRWCSCQSCAIDGGFDYLKVCGDNYEMVEFDLDVTKEQLFGDWNKGIDKYGAIKDE